MYAFQDRLFILMSNELKDSCSQRLGKQTLIEDQHIVCFSVRAIHVSDHIICVIAESQPCICQLLERSGICSRLPYSLALWI